MSDDIPSDFFDDFNKDEFMDGLSVVDSWDDHPDRKRISNLSEVLDSVDDLRELIREKDDYEEMEPATSRKQRSKSRNPLDDYIKPGSRRDPSKTYAAIRKDKEVKVKEILAKKLQSSDDLRPPGTELDDFYEDKVKKRKSDIASKEVQVRSHSKDLDRDIEIYRYLRDRRVKGRDRTREKDKERFREHQREPALDHDLESRYSRRGFRPQHRSPYRSYNRSPHRSPNRIRLSPRRWSPRRSPARHSPRRGSPRRGSPRRGSPRRGSPYYHSSVHHSPKNSLHSRSSEHVRRRPSPYSQNTDNFLYPEPNYGKDYRPVAHYGVPEPIYNSSPVAEYSTPTPGYTFTHTPAYTPGYTGQYEYHVPAPVPVPAPQPVPAPLSLPSEGQVPAPQVKTPATANTTMTPAAQVMKPNLTSSASQLNSMTDLKTPFDALAQLVAEGKLSQEDYLKLAPNKGTGSGMDTKHRIAVLNRCQEALTKLEKFTLPNHLVMNSNIVGSEAKSLPAKFCSPLKRQVAVEFHFTKQYGSKEQQNKQLIDSILGTIGLTKIVPAKKKVSRDMKDVAVQTTKPFCEMCEIRESTRFYDVGTVVDHDHFYSSAHTQVVDHELVSSKAIFNPSGSSGESRPISIAHMTPAQLVSQLAARAKTLKQSNEPSPATYDRRQYEQHQNQQSYHNYNNYRY